MGASKKLTFRSSEQARCGFRESVVERGGGTGTPEGLTFRSGAQVRCGFREAIVERGEDGRVEKADVPFERAGALRFAGICRRARRGRAHRKG